MVETPICLGHMVTFLAEVTISGSSFSSVAQAWRGIKTAQSVKVCDGYVEEHAGVWTGL